MNRINHTRHVHTMEGDIVEMHHREDGLVLGVSIRGIVQALILEKPATKEEMSMMLEARGLEEQLIYHLLYKYAAKKSG